MENQQEVNRGEKEIDQVEPGDDGPGSETERFRAINELRHNEAVTGESGVPRKQRDHELRCQQDSLAEFE
jgi:hypothetical protein